jgi:hypothetical protein
MGLVPRPRAVAGENYSSVIRNGSTLRVDLRPQNWATCSQKNRELCGKDATKWLVCERSPTNAVDK